MTTEEKKQQLLKYKSVLTEPYKKDNSIWYEASFRNLFELKDYIQSGPAINYDCFGGVSSMKVGDESFYTMSFEKAKRYLISGYNENISQMFELRNELRRGITFPSVTRKVIKSVTGSRICPNSFVTNNPKRYYKLERNEERKFITIHVNLAYSCAHDHTQVLNRGALIYNLIDILEKNNYSVKLNTFFLVEENNELIYIKIKLKDINSPLGVSGSIFPLTSPGFFRRIIFRVMESMPVDYYGWDNGYGHPVDGSDSKKLLELPENDIYIGSPREIGIWGNDLKEDTQKFLKYIDMDKYVRVKVKK